MDRIYNPEVIPDPREFTEGNPQTGIPATPLAAKWLNDLQEEVCAVIEAHAGVLDPNNRNQLRDAILDWVNHADAAKVDGVPIEMAGAADGYLLKVTGVYPNLQVTAVSASSIATPAQVARRWFSNTTEGVVGTTYYRASDTAPTGTSVSVVNTVTTANVENKIAEFISAATTTGFTLDKGLWSLRLWQRASNAGTELRLKYFIMNEATGIRAEVGLSHSYPIENTTDELGIYEVNVPATLTIAPGDRLGIGLYSYSTNNNRTVTVSFDGADRQSYIELPVVLNHNDLAGLQGGSGNERYHLTAAQLAQIGAPSVRVDVFTASGTWVKPEGAKSVHIFAMGAGGGGASGQVTSSINSSAAGGGGAGGAALDHLIEASILPATMAVVVGVGGNGGVPSSSTSFNAGTAGGNTFVHWGGEPYLARGGFGASSSFGASAMSGFYPSGAGGNSATAGAVPDNGAGIGGSGGGNMSSGSAYGGAYSRYPRRYGDNTYLLTGGAGGSGGDAVDTGAGSPSYQLFKYPGLGGGGGGSGYNTNGGRGGHAGHGGGGGGGGAALTGYQSGAGGRGGDGIVVITTWI